MRDFLKAMVWGLQEIAFWAAAVAAGVVVGGLVLYMILKGMGA